MYCKVTEQIYGIARLLEEDRKKPKDYGNGVLLYHSEMQFLDTIARYPDENVSGLSDRLGITKGAITQTVEKLKQKDLIITITRKDNKKEKYFSLTDKGQATLEEHRYHHQQSNENICKFISTLDTKEADAVFRFLEQMKQSVPFTEFRCNCKDDYERNKEESHYETNTIKCPRFTRNT